MSRAERFEDEKRRIIDSCFNKRDDDGSGAPDTGPLPPIFSASYNVLTFASHPRQCSKPT